MYTQIVRGFHVFLHSVRTLWCFLFSDEKRLPVYDSMSAPIQHHPFLFSIFYFSLQKDYYLFFPKLSALFSTLLLPVLLWNLSGRLLVCGCSFLIMFKISKRNYFCLLHLHLLAYPSHSSLSLHRILFLFLACYMISSYIHCHSYNLNCPSSPLNVVVFAFLSAVHSLLHSSPVPHCASLWLICPPPLLSPLSVLSSQSLYPSDSRKCPSHSPTWHSAQGPEG